MAATGGLGGIGGPPPSSGAIGAVGTTSAGEGPGRPISGAADAGQGVRGLSGERVYGFIGNMMAGRM